MVEDAEYYCNPTVDRLCDLVTTLIHKWEQIQQQFMASSSSALGKRPRLLKSSDTSYKHIKATDNEDMRSSRPSGLQPFWGFPIESNYSSIYDPTERKFRRSLSNVLPPLLGMPTLAAIMTIGIIRAEEVAREDAVETHEDRLTEAFTQDQVRSVWPTLLPTCHVTAASLLLTAHTDSVLSQCDHPPLTSPH